MRTLAAALCLTAATARAEVIYNNLLPGGQFTPIYAYFSYLSAPDAYVEVAWEFTPTGTGELDHMRSSLFAAFSAHTHVMLRLYADDGGAPTALLGAPLEVVVGRGLSEGRGRTAGEGEQKGW